MKKLLTFIIIAIVATSGIFAITTTDVADSPTGVSSLTDAKIAVSLGINPATITIAYDTGDSNFSQVLTDQTTLMDETWKIQESDPNDYVTNYFGVIFSNGSIAQTGSESTKSFVIDVIPGAFKTDTNEVAYRRLNGTWGDEVEIVPQATMGTGATSTPLNPTTGIAITTNPLGVGTFISRAIVATFNLSWTSADEDGVSNTEGLYTSTTTISIQTI
jgi:hypothetical protein